jgi:hypothetical protein
VEGLSFEAWRFLAEDGVDAGKRRAGGGGGGRIRGFQDVGAADSVEEEPCIG